MFVVSVRERGKEEHKFTFRKDKITIGRLRANDIILPKRNISKKHAEIELGPEEAITLLDMGSTNGSFINGKRVLEQVQVTADDKIFMGDYILQIEVTQDKSAMEDAGIDDIGSMEGTGDPDKPTVADLDSDLLQEELQRLGLPGEDNAGPATVVVDPSEVPSELPADLALAQLDEGEPPTADLDSLMETSGGDLPVDSMTLRDQEAPKVAEEPEEELIDIPLLEEEPELLEIADSTVDPVPEPAPEPAPAPEPEPVPAPVPEPEPVAAAPQVEEPPVRPPPSVTQQVRPFTPAVSTDSVLTTLSANYARVAAEYDAWAVSQGPEAPADQTLTIVNKLLSPLFAEELGPDGVDSLTGQVVMELTGIGAAGPLLENPKVGELYIAPSGQIVAYDWRGGIVDTHQRLTCPAATSRVAATLARSLGKDLSDGYVEGRLPDGMTVRTLAAPLASEEPGIRLVRPFQTAMSFDKLLEGDVASPEQVANMRKALQRTRSIFVLGRESQTNAIVVSALLSDIPEDRKVLASGDRFLGSNAGQRWTLFSADALETGDFAQACSAMDCHWVVVDNCGGDNAAGLVELGAVFQIPFIASVRTSNPRNIVNILSLTVGDPDLLAESIRTVSPVIITTRRARDGVDRVEGVHLFAVEGNRITLVPMSD